MQTLIIILFLLAWLSFLLQISITKQNITVIIFVTIIAIGLYTSYPYAIEQSYSKFQKILSNRLIMSNLMVLQIAESIIGIFFSIFLIRMFYNEKVHKIFRWFSYFPGIIIVPAIFYTQSFLFLNISAFSFKLLATTIAVLLPLIILSVKVLIKKIIPEYDLRLELKFMIHVLQLFVAIIISIKIFSLPITNKYTYQYPVYQLISLLVLLLVFTILGMLVYNIKIKKILNKKLKL